MLSDVACTGWHGNEMASVRQGDQVAVWGAGPVGLMAGYLALRLRGAKRVIIIDNVKVRITECERECFFSRAPISIAFFVFLSLLFDRSVLSSLHLRAWIPSTLIPFLTRMSPARS
jgi:hypothetical protein